MHARVQWGWRTPPLEPWCDVVATLAEAGFAEIREQDLSSEAVPATKKLRDRWLLFTFLMDPAGKVSQASWEFMEATVAYHEGLREGLFTYHFVSGARPA